MRKLVLRVCIGGAEDIDAARRNALDDRVYRVAAWLNPGQEFVTPPAEGRRDPTWKCSFDVAIHPQFDPLLLSTRLLHVEVIRDGSSDEPGTSRNSAVVGRARIPLPKLPRNDTEPPPPPSFRRYPLVATDENGVCHGGHIFIKMEIGLIVEGY